MWHLTRKYSSTRFHAYEYFVENRAITIGLRFALSENRLLKSRLRNECLQTLVPKDEWDGWNESTIESYFSKYVFAGRD